MIDFIYNINNKNIYIHCEIEEYCHKIEKWLSAYDIISSNKYSSYIKIYKNKTVWNIGGIEKIINNKIKHTDLYPLFYNLIANAVLDDDNVLLHSAVLCYNNVGILVVGDFDSGKTTLCLKAMENNVEVVSADQTHLGYVKNKIMLRRGSLYMRIGEDNEVFLSPAKSEIEIKLIINLVGVCDNGKLYFDVINNKEHIIKKMFKFCTWHSDIPLFTETEMLNIDRTKIYKWLSRINIPFYNVRGDSKNIIIKIKEVLK